MKKCKIIVVEGADKCGKATQSKMLAHALDSYGNCVALVEVPFNDHVTYPLIYWMLKRGQAKHHPNLFQFIQFCNKFIFQWTKLLWLRLTCDFVIFDRWSLSAIVYGNATGVNPTFNRVLYWLLAKPTFTVILHGPSFKRHEVDDVYEKDIALQKAVMKGYYDWVQEHPFGHELIDNQGTRDDVHERIVEAIEAA